MQKIKKYTIKNIILSLGVKQLDRAGILELLNTCGHDLVKKATMKDVTKATKFAIFCHNCHTTMKKKIMNPCHNKTFAFSMSLRLIGWNVVIPFHKNLCQQCHMIPCAEVISS